MGYLVLGPSIETAGKYADFIAIIVPSPGFSLTFAGLLVLALGGVLWRLDRIVRNTRPRRMKLSQEDGGKLPPDQSWNDSVG